MWFRLIPLLCLSSSTLSASKNFKLESFDSKCGKVYKYNCRGAFQAAFAALSLAGGGTLTLPATALYIDFPDLTNDRFQGRPLIRSKLLVVPANTGIVGATKPNGIPATIIQWAFTSIPIFIFNKANHSSMAHVRATFLGTQPTYYPYGDVDLLKALGYDTSFSHSNQMSGSNREIFSFIYEVDSDDCSYENLVFQSATKDNAHTFGNAFNLKGKGVITTNGAGLRDLSDGNSIRDVALSDFQNGMVISGQSHLTIEGVSANWRGSLPKVAPGHLIYLTAQNVFDADAHVIEAVNSSNVLLQDLSEGPDTYSNVMSGGTLAIKGVNGAVINNVISHHPEGLLQTIYAAQNLLFTNMTWTSEYDLCGNVPVNCTTPTINSAVSLTPYLPVENIVFQNVTLKSSITPTSVVLLGKNIQIRGMSIDCPPTFLPNQKTTNGVLNLLDTNGAAITDYSYTPILTSYSKTASYNAPLVVWETSTNVNAEVTLYWPSRLPVPVQGSTIITPWIQNQAAQANNHASLTLVSN